MNIIVTLAGKSERFKKAGIKKPKFFLPLEKSTVIEKVLDCYNDQDNFHLVVTKSQINKFSNLKNYLNGLKKNIYLNIIQDHDNGPAFTACKAKSCRLKDNIIVSYCDFLINWDYKKFKRDIFGYDFGITSFRGFHPSSFSGTLYCYLKVKNNFIKALREKKSFTSQPFNEYASVGSYFFKNFSLMEYYSFKALHSKQLRNKFGEIYMSLPFLFILDEKLPILNFEVKNFISLGTPKDYLEDTNWYNFFKQDKLSKNL